MIDSKNSDNGLVNDTYGVSWRNKEEIREATIEVGDGECARIGSYGYSMNWGDGLGDQGFGYGDSRKVAMPHDSQSEYGNGHGDPWQRKYSYLKLYTMHPLAQKV